MYLRKVAVRGGGGVDGKVAGVGVGVCSRAM